MNNKGSVVFVYFMLGIVFFVIGMALAPALVDTSGEAQTELNCANSSISNQDKSVCYQVDSFPALWLGVMFGFGGILLGRLIT